MGKITAIEVQRKNKKRYNVYIDDSFAFGVHEDVLILHKLTVGMELSTAFKEEVLVAEEQSKANKDVYKRQGIALHSLRDRVCLP